MSKFNTLVNEKTSVKTILILGATGYVGGALCQKFCQTQDFQVVALVRPSSNSKTIEPFCKEIAWIHVDDLADCYIAVARRGEKGGHYLAAPEDLSISQMATLFAQAAGVKFQPPIFENKDNVVFDDSYTREVLQLDWKYKVTDEVKAWVEQIQELGTYFLE
ncbi:hypothetical protein [Coleofasciculus sp. G2-EDA-02]|uniref:hypothetical protein n=1 Tax=Coleofasciculus sp. G2-EDA-02 TaxID=3069529 RepID=UPI0032FD659E